VRLCVTHRLDTGEHLINDKMLPNIGELAEVMVSDERTVVRGYARSNDADG